MWGLLAAASIDALAPGGRLVNFGSSGGMVAPLDSAVIRSKWLSVLGYTNLMVSFEDARKAVTELHGLAAEGRIQVHPERVGLDDVAPAFARAGSAPHCKLIVVPS